MAIDERKLSKGETILEAMRSKLPEGLIPSKIFHDSDIYEMEQQKIFAKAWMFLAHETEIPHPGDYVVRYIGENSLIVSRDESGDIRVLYNSCMHHGMHVCNVDMGNTSHFRCPYHGWTYKNDGKLAGVPFGKQLYGEQGLDKDQFGLKRVPHVDTYGGLIFACLNPEAESLSEYLGDFKWYLDIYLKKSEMGVEVYGNPHRWIMDIDWKLGPDNFIGDIYHLASAHRSVGEAGIAPNIHINSHLGVHASAGPGGVQMSLTPPGTFFGYPDFIVASMRKSLKPEQFDILSGENKYSLHQSAGTLFPNLSFAVGRGKTYKDDPNVPFTFMRLWNPVGLGKIECWSWLLVEKDAPQWYKEASYRSYVFSFGPSGTLEQDDAVNLESITRVAKGFMAHDHFVNYRMGMFADMKPLTDFPGPGIVYPTTFHESNQRLFYGKYVEYMSKE